MESANEVAKFIESVGVPVATALLFAFGGWWLLKYILNSIVEKIADSQSQVESDIKDLHTIIVALIDKNTQLQGDLIKLDTMIRVKWGLAPDEQRIGRQNGKRKNRWNG
tara:strand:+ start:237 stop:563 length:327 start_codon:yes stop_codon:yes gene_type:complete